VLPPRVVMPGDMLITTCSYNTLDRDDKTTFGLSTHNEMCLAYSVYYPRLSDDNTYCLSANYTGLYENLTEVAACADVNFLAGQMDLTVTQPYVQNCTRVPPDPTRTTPEPLLSWNSSTYQNHEFMDGQEDGTNSTYTIHWTVDVDKGEIALAVEVETDGWVGFGISETGGMVGSDVSIGWIGANGSINHRDRFAEKHALPPQDTLQDYYDIRGAVLKNDSTVSLWSLQRAEESKATYSRWSHSKASTSKSADHSATNIMSPSAAHRLRRIRPERRR